MKRVAESQLTKDSSDSDEEPTEGGTGLQKADPSVLGSRIMRGLPKRSLVSTSIPRSTDEGVSTAGSSNGTIEKPPEPVSRFGGFTGFGGGIGDASKFSFTVPPSQTNNTPSHSTSKAAFSTMSTSPAPISFPPHPNLSNPTPPSTPPLTPNVQNKQDVALKYYISLRGINSSFLDSVTSAIRTDPFVDIGETLEKYKSLRLAVQQEFDSHSKASGTGESAKLGEPFVASQEVSLKASPSASTSNTGAATGSSASGALASTTGGFIPKADSSLGGSASPFAWPKPSVSTTSENPTSSGFSFTFGKTTSAQPPVESNTSLTDAGHTVNVLNTKPAVPSHPILGSNKPPAKADMSSFSFKLSTSAPPLTPGLSSFLSTSKPTLAAGEPSSSSPVKFGAQSASPPSPSTFGFGSGKNLGVSSPFGSFSKGSIGNPVGFGFGGPPMTPHSAGTSNPAATSEAEAPANTDGADNSSADGSSLIPLPTEHDPSPAPSQGSAYDADGPGEEEERTLHEIKAHAFKMTTTGEKKSWTSVGTGQMKLKAHNEFTRRRILMRNSSTGQVILNFNLSPLFQVTVDKKSMSFRVPGEDESAAVYRLRVSSEADALKWQDIICDEVNRLVTPSDT